MLRARIPAGAEASSPPATGASPIYACSWRERPAANDSFDDVADARSLQDVSLASREI